MIWEMFIKELGEDVKMTHVEQQSSSQGARRIVGCLTPALDYGLGFFEKEFKESHGRFMMWNDPVQRFHAQKSLNKVLKDVFQSWIDVIDMHSGDIELQIQDLIEKQKVILKEQEIRAEAEDHVKNRLEEEQARRAALAQEAKKFNHGT